MKAKVVINIAAIGRRLGIVLLLCAGWIQPAPAATNQEPAYAEDVITPHWKWEGWHTGGTVRALFLTEWLAARQPQELAQRFDFEVGVLPLTGNWDQPGCDQTRFGQLLTQKWDVVVMATPKAWSTLSESNQSLLIGRIRGGLSLVLYPQHGQGAVTPAPTANPDSEGLSSLLDPPPVAKTNLATLLKTAKAKDLTAAVARAIPLNNLTFRGPFRVREFPVDRGRIIQVEGYHTHWTRFNAFMGVGVNGQHQPAWFNDDVTPELFYALAGRWVRLAAGRESPYRMMRSKAPADPAPLAAPVVIRLALQGNPAAGDNLAWTLYSPLGESLTNGLVSLAALQTEVECRLLPNHSGRLLFRWQWRRKAATLDWGADWIAVTSPVAFAAVNLPAEVPRGAPCDIAWTLNKPAADTDRVLAQVYDPDGRLLAMNSALASAGRLQLAGWIPRSITHQVRVLLLGAGGVVDECRRPVQVQWDRALDLLPYHVIVWATEQGEIFDRYRYQLLRDLGVTAMATPARDALGVRLAGAQGLRAVPTNILVPPNRFKRRFLKAEEERDLAAFIRAVAACRPLGYSLADEPEGIDPVFFRNWGAEIIRRHDPAGRVGYCGVCEGFDKDVPAFFAACDFAEPYSPFHIYSPDVWQGCERDLYRSFKAPNAIVTCWTHYAPWRDHEPYSRTVPWLWLFEGLNGVSYFDSAGDPSAGEFAVLPPDLRATHETRWWSREVLDIQRGIGEQIIAARRDTGAIRILFHPGATGGDTWARALNESHVPYRFISHTELEGALESDARLLVCPNVDAVADAELAVVRRFLAQGGTVLATAPFARRPRASMKVAAAIPDDAVKIKTTALPKPGESMPEDVLAELDKADKKTAQRKEIAKPAEPAAPPDRIRSLFGIQWTIPALDDQSKKMAAAGRGIPATMAWTNAADGAGARALTGTTLGEYGVRAAAPGQIKAMFRQLGQYAAGETNQPDFIRQLFAAPALVETRVGTGRALYLTFQPDAASLKQWLPALMSAAGIARPDVRLTLAQATNSAVYLYPFSRGPIRLIGVIQDYCRVPPAFNVEGGKETALYYHHGPQIWAGQKAALETDAPFHFYDVRRGQYLGCAQRAEFELAPGRPELFALLPYRVEELALRGLSDVAPGQTVDLEVELKVRDGALGDHVVHITLTDPAGRGAFADRHNLHTRSGRGTLRFQMPFNALSGAWTLAARDAITGLAREQVFMVKPGKTAEAILPFERSRVRRTPLDWPEGRLVPLAPDSAGRAPPTAPATMNAKNQ